MLPVLIRPFDCECLDISTEILYFMTLSRGVAQLGSALGSGPRGREFKSPLPDHFF